MADFHIPNGTTQVLSGVVDNPGSSSVDAAADDTNLAVAGGATLTLQGGGTVDLSDSSHNRIYANGYGSTLDNVDNTIHGAGQIFAAYDLQVINEAAGVINGDAVNNALVLRDLNKPVINDGLIESTNSGGLTLQAVTIDNAGGGTIQATGSGHVDLNGAAISGGTFKTSGGGKIQTVGGSNLIDGRSSTTHITTGSAVTINDGTSLAITGVIDNKGSINLAASAGAADLMIRGGDTATLQGGGTIAMSDSASNRIYANGYGAVLDNIDNTIEGAGQIFAFYDLVLKNQAGGTIDGNAATNALVIRDFSNTIVNNGVIQSTNAGGLTLQSVRVDGSGGGSIKAAGTGHVDLNGATIIGGTLSTDAGGIIRTVGGSNLLDGRASAVHIASGDAVTVSNGTTLALAGEIDNKGVIDLNSANASSLTDLQILGGNTTTLSGGGVIDLSGSSANRVYANGYGAVLDNVNNTIKGGGEIFSNYDLVLKNEAGGLINATDAANALLIRDFGNAIINNGVMQASAGAGLSLRSVTIDGSGGGVLQALEGGAHVDLSATTIKGGVLKTANGGKIQAVAANGSNLNGDSSAVTIDSGSAVTVLNGASLATRGSIVNHGAIQLDSVGAFADLQIQGGATTTLTGGGRIAFSDFGNNRIYANGYGAVLDNVDNTIEGGGQIFSNYDLVLKNGAGGVIDGNAATNALVLGYFNNAIINSGSLQSSGAGGLTLQSVTIDGSSGGVIQALGAGHVDLSNATIKGGTLTNTGLIRTISASTLDGTNGEAPVHIDAMTTLHVTAGTSLSLKGVIDNKGVIAADASAAGFSDLVIPGGASVSLQGGGHIVLTDSVNSRIYASGYGAHIDNVDNTIEGAGQIFANYDLTLTNKANGVIDATGTNSLNLSLASLTNEGVFHANDGNVLNVQVDGGHVFTNLSAGALTGGTYLLDSNGTISFNGGGATAISTLAADVALASGSFLGVSNGTATSIDQSLTTIAAGAHLSLFAHNATWSHAITVSGTLNLNNDVFTNANGVTIASGGGAGGFGVFATTILNDGFIAAAGGSLLFQKAVSGDGEIGISGGATAAFASSVSDQTITFNHGGGLFGTLSISALATFDATLKGFAVGDQIDLTFVPGAHAFFSAPNMLAIEDSGGAILKTIQLASDYTGFGVHTASDGAGGTLVTLSAPVANHAPISGNDGYAVAENGSLVVAAAQGVLANDSDQDGDALTAAIVSGPAHGVLTLQPNGSFTYTPNANYHGADSFTYQAFDGAVGGNIATVSINVSGNQNPVAGADNGGHTTFNTPKTLLASSLLANDSDPEHDQLSIISLTSGAGGTVAFDGDHNIVFTPTIGYAGPADFSYTLSDGHGGSAIGRVSLTVDAPPNTPPVAVDDNFTGQQNKTIQGNVLANDTDADGNVLSASVVTGPQHGSLTLLANGTFAYTPTAGYYGSDSFTYRAGDGFSTSGVATVSLDVQRVLQGPTAVGGDGVAGHSWYAATPGATTFWNALTGVLANDSSLDGLPIHAELIEGPYFKVNGRHVADTGTSVALGQDGSLSIAVQPYNFGVDYIRYVAVDSNGQRSQPIEVAIHIGALAPSDGGSTGSGPGGEDPGPGGSGPIAVGGDGVAGHPWYPATPGATTFWNSTVGVLVNDKDTDGLPLHAKLIEGPYFKSPDDGHHIADPGTIVTLGNDGSLVISVQPYNVGIDYIRYVAVDSNGVESEPVEVAIHIGALGPDPDPDPNPNPDPGPQIPGAPPGSGTGDGWGDVHFTTFDGLHYDFQGVGEFIAAESIDPATPLGVQIRTKPFGATVSVTSAIATEVDGHRVTYDGETDTLRVDGAVVSVDPAVGSIAIGSNGAKLYHIGNEFAVTTPGNHATVYFTDAGSYLNFRIAADATLNGKLVGLLGNHDGSTINDIALGDGSVLPQPLSFGDLYDQFGASWRVTNANTLFDYDAGKTTTDYTDLNFPHHPLTLADLPPDVVAAARQLAIAAGITDPALLESAILDFVLTGDPSTLQSGKSAVTPTDDLTVTFVPPPKLVGVSAATPTLAEGNSGSTDFTFVIYRTDNVGDLDVQWSIGTSGFNIANAASADDFASAAALSGSVHFADGETQKTITIPVQGDHALEHDEQFTVNLSLDEASPYALVAPSVMATILDDDAVKPTSGADSFTLTTGSAVSGDVLANDTGGNGEALTAKLVGAAQHGTVDFHSDGTFTYTPDANYVGPDRFFYQAQDSYRAGDITQVLLTVNPTPTQNRAPVSVADSYGTNENAPLIVDAAHGLLANDTDADNNPLTAVLGSGPAHGVLHLNADGSFSYTPDANYSGLDSFTYHANDGKTDGNSVIVSLAVTHVNHAPTAGADSYTVLAGNKLVIPVAALLGNDSDPDGDTLSITAASGGQHGAVVLNNGNIEFTPASGYVGAAGFSYTLDDGHGGATTGAVSINVTPAYVYGAAATAGLVVDYSYDAAKHTMLGSAFDDVLRAGSGGDTLNGGAGNDYIFGGSGKDSITGGAGADVVSGGGGADTFIFNKGDFADPALTGGKLDMIMDFEGAGDGYKSGFGDMIRFQGFSSAATLTHSGDVAGHPEQHIYDVRDGAFHAQFIIQYAGAGSDLIKGDYGFYV